MIIVDTSIWATHLDRPVAALGELLSVNEVLMHPFIIGELLLGNLAHRSRLRSRLELLPQLLPARHHAVLDLIDDQLLFGSGLGYVDAHLIAASRMRPGTLIWTTDKRFRAAAERLGVAAELN